MHNQHLKTLRSLQEELAQQRPALAADMAMQLDNFKDTIQATLQQSTLSLSSQPEVRRRSEDLPSPTFDRVERELAQRPRSTSTGRTATSEHDTGTLGSGTLPQELVWMGGRAGTTVTQHLELDVSCDASAAISQATSEPTVALQLSQRQRGRCKSMCSCQCHRSSRLKTPDFMRQVTGQLLIGYSGISSLTAPCNERACAQRQKASVRVQYHFPVWSFIQRVLTLISYSAGARGPEKILRLSRIRPGLHEVFIQVQSGNIRRLEQLFRSGEASPLDASDTGWTLLHYALVAGQLRTAKFLTDAGADVYAESMRRETPFDLAWNRILSGYLAHSSKLLLRDIFSDVDHLDERQFTTPHKIVLGLIGRDLASELEVSTANIDSLDNSGYSPLAWAAARGDVKCIRTLLDYGASLSTTNDLGYQPIHLAAQSGNVETVGTLVDAGADINAEVRETFMTPMHYAAEYQDSSEHVNGIANLGARIEARDYMMWTPLHWASWRGHSFSLDMLIERGADVFARTHDGNAAIMLATANNSANCIPSLIKAGADCKVVRDSGWNVLHYAALGGTVHTLDVLAAGDLSDIDVHHQRTTDTQQSVSDMVAQRLAAMDDAGEDKQTNRVAWQSAWKRLMKATLVSRSRTSTASSRRQSASSTHSSDDGAAFADACELLYEHEVE